MDWGKLLKVIINVIVLVLVIIFLIIFAIYINKQKEDNKRLKLVEQYDDIDVYVDTETGISYAYYHDGWEWERGWFSLYDVDGNHYRPNGWRDYSAY